MESYRESRKWANTHDTLIIQTLQSTPYLAHFGDRTVIHTTAEMDNTFNADFIMITSTGLTRIAARCRGSKNLNSDSAECVTIRKATSNGSCHTELEKISKFPNGFFIYLFSDSLDSSSSVEELPAYLQYVILDIKILNDYLLQQFLIPESRVHTIHHSKGGAKYIEVSWLDCFQHFNSGILVGSFPHDLPELLIKKNYKHLPELHMMSVNEALQKSKMIV